MFKNVLPAKKVPHLGILAVSRHNEKRGTVERQKRATIPHSAHDTARPRQIPPANNVREALGAKIQNQMGQKRVLLLFPDTGCKKLTFISFEIHGFIFYYYEKINFVIIKYFFAKTNTTITSNQISPNCLDYIYIYIYLL